jgi:AraC-like DNA-binding protein
MTEPCNRHSLDDLWPVQISLVKETAESPEPTLKQLYTVFLEEFGHGPGIDHIDYFISMTEISTLELKEYLEFSGIPLSTDSTPDSGTAKSVICSNSSTVLEFLEDFKKKYGVPPSEHLTKLYLEEIKDKNTSNIESRKTEKRNQQDFARKIADTPRPTVLTFRKQFIKKFGLPPSDKITKIFLERMQDKNQEDEVYFARTGANGSLSTVLEFRQAFTKTYGKTPSEELIKMFITNRTSGHKTAG